MIGNYGSNLCIDNDDGSAYYLNHHNFEVYGGHKSDFGGHNKFTYDSVIAYALVYDEGVCGWFWNDVIPGFVDGFFNNICIQGVSVPYLNLLSCDPKNPAVVPDLRTNVVYNANKTLQVKCGDSVMSEHDFQRFGFDLGTTVDGPIPSDDNIIFWGMSLLNQQEL